jgi:hypothetical protein
MVKHRAAADEDGGAVFIIILLLPLHVMVQLVEALRYKLEGCRKKHDAPDTETGNQES